MTPADLAALHARCFVTPRPWSALEFTALLQGSGVFLESADHGFALGRLAGPEVELLTLAVAPEVRRTGQGSNLLARFEAAAQTRAALEAFLEVAADNTAACALYARAGYAEVGRRSGYFLHPDGRRTDAMILRKALADS